MFAFTSNFLSTYQSLPTILFSQHADNAGVIVNPKGEMKGILAQLSWIAICMLLSRAFVVALIFTNISCASSCI